VVINSIEIARTLPNLLSALPPPLVKNAKFHLDASYDSFCFFLSPTESGRMPWIAWIKHASPDRSTILPLSTRLPDERTTGLKRLQCQPDPPSDI
jgi:hypothetical protein